MLEHLELVGLPQVDVEVVRPVILDLRHRAEAPHPCHRHVEAALATADDLALERLARAHGLGELLLEPALDGEVPGHPHFVPDRHHDHLDRVAGAQLIELLASQHGLGLAADVHQRDVAVDRGDGSLDHVADLHVVGGKAVEQGFLELVGLLGFVVHGRPHTSEARMRTRSGRIAQGAVAQDLGSGI
jgi:hypothetical protein